MTERPAQDEPKVAEAVAEALTADPVVGADLVVLKTSSHNQWRDVWDQFKTHKGALAGAAIFLLIFVGTVFGPCMWRISPTYIDLTAINQGSSWDIHSAPTNSVAICLRE
ncbi:hypothetical protein J2R96_001992 [Bradyrhizobium elkanii]|nr:hypothetical protein [Bradyrhizobium elkanii]